MTSEQLEDRSQLYRKLRERAVELDLEMDPGGDGIFGWVRPEYEWAMHDPVVQRTRAV